jgi:hypothetical protein
MLVCCPTVTTDQRNSVSKCRILLDALHGVAGQAKASCSPAHAANVVQHLCCAGGALLTGTDRLGARICRENCEALPLAMLASMCPKHCRKSMPSWLTVYKSIIGLHDQATWLDRLAFGRGATERLMMLRHATFPTT